MDPKDMLDWQIKVEKRLAELEARVFQDEPVPAPPKPRGAQGNADDLVLRAWNFILSNWAGMQKPTPMRQFSARFARTAITHGISVDRILEELVGQGRMVIGRTESGARYLMPAKHLGEVTSEQRAMWGLESAEEREAREVNEGLKKLLAQQG